MKIFHISDLHIGKQLHFYNMKDDQIAILAQIVDRARELRPDALIIAGDIYDKTVPSAEAYTIFNRFLNDMSELKPDIPVLIIAGNHDSAERLNYASAFLEKENIFISVQSPGNEDEYLKKIVLKDEYGDVNFYMLPFTKPGHVRHLFDEGIVTSYDSAVKALIKRENIDYSKRNVLISHQFYISGDVSPETCDSEQVYITVGGIDSVDIEAVKDFDYVALGHLHGAQSIGMKHIRYSGTPLKYSVSEEKHVKAITMVTLNDKGSEPVIDRIPLYPIRDVRSEKGLISDIISRATDTNRHDYISITITDEDEIYRPKDQLEEHYDHILEVKIDNSRTRARLEAEDLEAAVLDPLEAFKQFYQEMQGVPMSSEEESIMIDVINKLQERGIDETVIY
ncbi:MAG: exonuclease SbcCD subunit D [Clostridiales bacterium]|jgi:exonuclease SbcD|nr:exonuclease SbcCD subunit D [Clostridiales bacterium]